MRILDLCLVLRTGNISGLGKVWETPEMRMKLVVFWVGKKIQENYQGQSELPIEERLLYSESNLSMSACE